jgi:hypothetical protein
VQIDIHENKVEPLFGLYWFRRNFFGRKSLDAFDIGRADQLAVGLVSPPVISAAKSLREPRPSATRPCAMAAPLVESPQLGVGVTNDQEGTSGPSGRRQERLGVDPYAPESICPWTPKSWADQYLFRGRVNPHAAAPFAQEVTQSSVLKLGVAWTNLTRIVSSRTHFVKIAA